MPNPRSMVLFLALAYATAAAADERKFDAWETRNSARLTDLQAECIPLAARMIEVPAATRAQALALLEKQPIARLSAAQLQTLVPGRVLDARQLAEDEAMAHEKQAFEEDARLANGKRVRGGTARDDDAYSALVIVRSKYRAGYNRWGARYMKPYLVRGVVLNESTGGFGVSECERTVVVSHGSLGRSWPTPDRRALVVFLVNEPMDVIVTTSMAE